MAIIKPKFVPEFFFSVPGLCECATNTHRVIVEINNAVNVAVDVDYSTNKFKIQPTLLTTGWSFDYTVICTNTDGTCSGNKTSTGTLQGDAFCDLVEDKPRYLEVDNQTENIPLTPAEPTTACSTVKTPYVELYKYFNGYIVWTLSTACVWTSEVHNFSMGPSLTPNLK